MKPTIQVANYLTKHGPKTQQELMDAMPDLDTSQSTLSRILNDSKLFNQLPFPGSKLFSYKDSGPPTNIEALIGGSILRLLRLQANYARDARNQPSVELESTYIAKLQEIMFSIDRRLSKLSVEQDQP